MTTPARITPPISQEDADGHRTYLEGYAVMARERVIRDMQSLVNRLQKWDQEARERPEFTMTAHQEMQSSILWTVHNMDLTNLMRSAAGVLAWDQQYPREQEEEANANAA